MSYIYRARIHINNGVHDDVLQANGKQLKPGFTTYQPQPNNSRALSKMKKKQQKAIKNNKTKIILINLQEEP